MEPNKHGENLAKRSAGDVTEVLYDSGLCFGTPCDFVNYLADLQTKEFFYIYTDGRGEERVRVLIRQLNANDIRTIRENLGGNQMGAKLEELEVFEAKTKDDWRTGCDYMPAQLHLVFTDGKKFSVKFDQAQEQLPEHLQLVAAPLDNLPPEFFPSRAKTYPGDIYDV